MNAMNSEAPILTISQLAARCQVTAESLRYYERERLLLPSARTAAGYRLYAESDVRVLQFILHAKQVGYSLSEVKHLLSLRLHKSEHSCQEVKDYTAAKIDEIEAKMHDLEQIRRLLKEMHNACCGGAESAERCSILRMLDRPPEDEDSRPNNTVTKPTRERSTHMK